METTQTLHDFVLNLLTDADARSAFELDPEGALRAAGLSDITAADVQDVVPLVMDYAPVQGIASLESLGDADLGLGTVTADPLGVIGQLTTVAQGLNVGTHHSSTVEVNAAALGVVGVDASGLAASVLPGIGLGVGAGGVAADLSGVNDVAHTLDAGVLNPVTLDAVGAVGTVDGVAAGAGGTVGDLLVGTGGTVEGLLGDGVTGVAGNALGTVGGTVDSLGVTGVVGGVTGTVGGTVESVGVDGVVGGVTGTVGGTVESVGVDGVLGGVTGTVGGTLDGVGVGNVTGGLGLEGGASVEANGSTDASGQGLLGGLL